MPIVDYLVQNDSSAGQFFRDARLDRFSCRFGSRSEFTDNVKRLTSRHPDCRPPGGDRKTRVVPRSHRSESDHAKPVIEYLSAIPVARVSAETILTDIRQRKEKGISNVTINMEVGIKRRVLKRAKSWSIVADEVPRLPERRDIGRAMSHAEKARLLLLSAAKPEWTTAKLAVILALNTTMGGCELKGLCWRDVDFIEWAITVRRSKTAAGKRVIPLNSEAWRTELQLRDRARKLFGDDLLADWHLFPHAEGYSKPDPTKPMNGWRSA